MIHVRAARRDDADQLADAHIQGWRVGYRGVFPDEFLDSDDFANERIERWRAWTWTEFAGSSVYVASVAGRVVGFSHLGRVREVAVCDQVGIADAAKLSLADGGEVYGFYLHPDAWGSGAAAELMTRSVVHLTALGYRAAVLWVLRDNPRARRFYEKSGWDATGRETMWEGPQSTSAIPLPVAEVQYRRTLP